MQRTTQTAAALGARAVAAGAAVTAVAVTASYYAAEPTTPFPLILGATLGDAASPIAFAAACRSGGSRGLRGVALAMCLGVAALSANSTYQTGARLWVAPITEAETAGDRLSSIRAEIATLERQSAAREAARQSERRAIAGARATLEAARARRDAADACSGGRFQPNAANPRCRAQSEAYDSAAATLARLERTADESEAAQRQRETDLASLRRDERAATDAAGQGGAGFRGLAALLGVTSTIAATITAAVLAFVIAVLGTVGFQLASLAAPFPAMTPAAKRRAVAAKAASPRLVTSQATVDTMPPDLPTLEIERREAVLFEWKALMQREKIDAEEAANRLRVLHKRKISARSLRRWAAEEGRAMAVAAE